MNFPSPHHPHYAHADATHVTHTGRTPLAGLIPLHLYHHTLPTTFTAPPVPPRPPPPYSTTPQLVDFQHHRTTARRYASPCYLPRFPSGPCLTRTTFPLPTCSSLPACHAFTYARAQTHCDNDAAAPTGQKPGVKAGCRQLGEGWRSAGGLFSYLLYDDPPLAIPFYGLAAPHARLFSKQDITLCIFTLSRSALPVTRVVQDVPDRWRSRTVQRPRLTLRTHGYPTHRIAGTIYTYGLLYLRPFTHTSLLPIIVLAVHYRVSRIPNLIACKWRMAHKACATSTARQQI